MADKADDAFLKIPDDIPVPLYVKAGVAEDRYVEGFKDGWEQSRTNVKTLAEPRPSTIVTAPWPLEARDRGVILRGAAIETLKAGETVGMMAAVVCNEHNEKGPDSFEDPTDPDSFAKRLPLTSIEQIYIQGFQRGWTDFASRYVQRWLRPFP